MEDEYAFVGYIERCMDNLGYDMEVCEDRYGMATIIVKDKHTGNHVSTLKDLPLDEYSDDWLYGFYAGFQTCVRLNDLNKSRQERPQ